MLKHFQLLKGGTVAINPLQVILVTELANHTQVIMVDGGTTQIKESYIDVVARLNERD
jgi:F0F1-type ATP synthase epsilon subunit